MAQEEEEENKMFETPEDGRSRSGKRQGPALADLLAAYSHAAERSGFGDFQEAVEAWSKVLQLEESFQAYQERGSALAILERFEEAEADFGEALARAQSEEEQERSSVYFSRGSARGDAGREAEAIEDFGEALKLEPERLEAWLSRGTAYLALGKLDNASSDAEAALKLQRDSGAAWGLLGAIRQRQSLFREAVDACQMALKLEPTLSWAERCLEASLAELEQDLTSERSTRKSSTRSCAPSVRLERVMEPYRVDAAEEWIKNPENIKDLTGKVALITGVSTSSGLGFYATKALALKGAPARPDRAQCVITVRNVEKGEAVKADLEAKLQEDGVKPKIAVMKMDNCDFASIRSFTDEFKKQYDRLDIVCNNAGVMGLDVQILGRKKNNTWRAME
eukprot:g17318.t1